MLVTHKINIQKKIILDHEVLSNNNAQQNETTV